MSWKLDKLRTSLDSKDFLKKYVREKRKNVSLEVHLSTQNDTNSKATKSSLYASSAPDSFQTWSISISFYNQSAKNKKRRKEEKSKEKKRVKKYKNTILCMEST